MTEEKARKFCSDSKFLITKKWFSNEKSLLINYPEYNLQIKKVEASPDYNEFEMNGDSKKDVKLIQVEVQNNSKSLLYLHDFKLNASESISNILSQNILIFID